MFSNGRKIRCTWSVIKLPKANILSVVPSLEPLPPLLSVCTQDWKCRSTALPLSTESSVHEASFLIW